MDESLRTHEELTTRKVVEQAARLLMSRHGLTEPEAFRRIVRLCMNYHRSMREVAEAVLLTDELAHENS
jgi:response regulator NasT